MDMRGRTRCEIEAAGAEFNKPVDSLDKQSPTILQPRYKGVRAEVHKRILVNHEKRRFFSFVEKESCSIIGSVVFSLIQQTVKDGSAYCSCSTPDPSPARLQARLPLRLTLCSAQMQAQLPNFPDRPPRRPTRAVSLAPVS